jgi:hypothetical protein
MGKKGARCSAPGAFKEKEGGQEKSLMHDRNLLYPGFCV